jgi:hypothetical protein
MVEMVLRDDDDDVGTGDAVVVEVAADRSPQLVMKRWT